MNYNQKKKLIILILRNLITTKSKPVTFATGTNYIVYTHVCNFIFGMFQLSKKPVVSPKPNSKV